MVNTYRAATGLARLMILLAKFYEGISFLLSPISLNCIHPSFLRNQKLPVFCPPMNSGV